ncbi:MAG: DUF502 domain-containing protein [Sphingomonadales bacterium]
MSAATPEEPPESGEPAKKRGILARLRNYLLTGIVVAAPIGITAYLTYVFIVAVDDRVTPLIPDRYNPQTYLPFAVPGLGLVIMVVALILLGMVTANFFGRHLLLLGERILARVPIVRSIYGTLKQIFETVISQSSMSFRDVVLIEYPRRGLWAIAFVTATTKGEIRRRLDDDLVNVFLPTTPNPTSGFLLFVPRRDLIFLDMPVEDGIKYVISAGLVTPGDRPPKQVVQVPLPRQPD